MRLKTHILYATTVACLFAGCSGKQTRHNVGGSDSSANESVEISHADNDIAMTVRSIVDAIDFGENLTARQYNFQGTLTDGRGVALYTDDQGAPGEWIVKVINTSEAIIYNTSTGDLLPIDLQAYITDCLQLTDRDIVGIVGYDAQNGNKKSVYKINAGTISFENNAGMVTISIKKDSN